jgi:hypothetical protein
LGTIAGWLCQNFEAVANLVFLDMFLCAGLNKADELRFGPTTLTPASLAIGTLWESPIALYPVSGLYPSPQFDHYSNTHLNLAFSAGRASKALSSNHIL